MSDTLSTPSKEDVKATFTVLVDILLVVLPQVGYVFQYIKISRAPSSSGYSPLVSLILLCSNTIRIYYYYGFHYRLSLFIQAICSVLVHMILLHKLITVQTEKQQMDNRFYVEFGREATALEIANPALDSGYLRSPAHKEVAPVLPPAVTPPPRLPDDHLALEQPQSNPSCALLRLSNNLEARFRSTNYLNFWITYFVCAILGLIAALLLFDLTVYDWFAVNFVGYLALGIEALLLVPQALRNANQGSTEGLSPVLIICWVAGDVLKLVYFIFMKQPMPFWVCTIFQLAVDFVLLGQIIYYSRKRLIDVNISPT